MRVAFVVGWTGGVETGPFKKIAEQTGEWSRQGCEVGLFVLTEQPSVSDWRALPGVREVLARSAQTISLARQKEALVSAALRWNPDVLYHRYSFPYPGLVRAGRRAHLVLEVNTDDIAEYDLLSPRKGRINRLTRGLVFRAASGIVFVTEELSKSPSFARFGRPSAVVANGLLLDSVAWSPSPGNARPRLVFLGQPGCPWHGVDKLVELARLRPQWDFDVIGPDAAEVGPASPNLTVHGALAAPDYAGLLAVADIGVGSLALHRKNMEEASALKLREYLASGLPSIIAYRDTDFPAPRPFLLQLPNNEPNVADHLEEIDTFVSRWHGQRVDRGDIAHVDARAKEAERLRFFHDIAAGET